VNGIVPDFWKLLIDEMSNGYGTPIALEWVVNATTNDSFTALYRGHIDAGKSFDC